MTKRRLLAAAAIAIVLTTSGCQGHVGADVAETTPPVETPSTSATASTEQSPSPTPTTEISSPTPTATEIPSATPTPTETASAGRPDMADLRLSSEGLGYVRIAQPVPEVAADERIVEWDDNYCEFTGEGEKPGGWKITYPKTNHLQFYVQAYPKKSSPVSAIYVVTDKIRTEHGLGVGSSLADVKALGGVKEEPKKQVDFYLDPWVIHGSAGELVFWIANDTAEKADRDTVQNVEVIAEGAEPAFSFEVGPCEGHTGSRS